MTCWQLGKWNPAFYCQPATQAMPGLFSGIYMVSAEHNADAQNRVGGERGGSGNAARWESFLRKGHLLSTQEGRYTQTLHTVCLQCLLAWESSPTWPGYVITLATSSLRSKLSLAMCVNACVFEKEAVREWQKKKKKLSCAADSILCAS